jgi:threonine dehydratase
VQQLGGRAVDAVVVAVGGGGLISGIGAAVDSGRLIVVTANWAARRRLSILCRGIAAPPPSLATGRH